MEMELRLEGEVDIGKKSEAWSHRMEKRNVQPEQQKEKIAFIRLQM